MSAKRILFPDLSKFPTISSLRAEYPHLKFGPANFYRERKRQAEAQAKARTEAKKESLSIIESQNNAVETKYAAEQARVLKSLVKSAQTQNIPIKNILPPEAIALIAQKAIESIRLHMASQWQCAAWWLERVHSDIFAKKDAPSSAAAVIGIKIEMAPRSVQQSPGSVYQLPLSAEVKQLEADVKPVSR